MIDLAGALQAAVAAAREAGRLLLQDFHRPGGPRGAVDKAEADVEAEQLIRARLRAAFPGFGYLGEETGRASGEPGAPIWVVDPNDGTRDYLRGARGSAVSIALVHRGRPLAGVVHAFAFPDDAGTLYAWAEGLGPLRREGVACHRRPPERLLAQHVVLVSSAGDRAPEGNARCAAPARFRAVPSIAHRLAMVAAGEAAAATSLFNPCAWDYAGGHALLRGVGGVLVDEAGREIGYAEDATSSAQNAFAGSRPVTVELAARPWNELRTTIPRERGPARLAPGQAIADARLLARAQGCLLGQLAGDSLGGPLELETAAAIAARHADGPRQLADAASSGLRAGQPTDDSEMALALARSMLREGGFDPARVAEAYRAWLASDPFDVGRTTRAGLSGSPLHDSQANGSLMRASPLGIYGHALPAAALAELARADAALTHPHRVCGDAGAAFVIGVAHAIATGAGAEACHAAALGWARAAGAGEVVERLEAARSEPPRCDGETPGFVLLTLHNAFYELLHAPSLEEGVVRSVRRGGDTDTNAAVAGALLGAVHGREAVPAGWRAMVLTARALDGARARPMAFWPTDACEIAERLLVLGRRA